MVCLILKLLPSDIGTPTGEGLDFINGQTFLERFYSVFDTTNRRGASIVHANNGKLTLSMQSVSRRLRTQTPTSTRWHDFAGESLECILYIGYIKRSIVDNMRCKHACRVTTVSSLARQWRRSSIQHRCHRFLIEACLPVYLDGDACGGGHACIAKLVCQGLLGCPTSAVHRQNIGCD